MQKRKTQVNNILFGHGRIPPQAIELELAVLGGLLQAAYGMSALFPILKPEVFYKETHQKICKAMVNLIDKNAPIDTYTVIEELMKLGELEDVGGAFYVTGLIDNVTNTANTQYHYRVLMEKYFRRQMIQLAYEMAEKAYKEEDDIFSTFETIIYQIEDLQTNASVGSYHTIQKAIQEVKNIINHVEGDTLNYYPIGDSEIDGKLMISPGNILNVSGKSGCGKTTLIVHMARLLLEQYDKIAFCWYTMEDEKSKIIMNFLSPKVKLTHEQMHGKNYKLTDRDKQEIEEELKVFDKYDVEFVEKSTSMARIKMHFKRFCAKRPGVFCVLIIDNVMKLADTTIHRFKSSQTEVDEGIADDIGRLFVDLKDTYAINIWFVHHLTKAQLEASNYAEGYRPREGQIRGSTRLRDISTQGLLVHRPGEFVDIKRQYRKSDYEGPVNNLIISEVYKNRNGELGFIRHFAHLGYKIFYPLKSYKDE